MPYDLLKSDYGGWGCNYLIWKWGPSFSICKKEKLWPRADFLQEIFGEAAVAISLENLTLNIISKDRAT